MPHVTKRGDDSLRVCYRPMQKDEFYGFNVDAVLEAINRPNRTRVIMLCGPTGCGKTSLARYIGYMVNCDNSDGVNPCLMCESCLAAQNNDGQLLRELNMADKTGIDDTRDEIRRLRSHMLRPDKTKVLILDEAQQLSQAAQQGWLKILEEPPEHALIILCTTKPGNFRDDLVNRTSQFFFRPLLREEGIQFLMDIAKSEGITAIDEVVAGNIFDVKGGRPRELINAAEKILVEGPEALNSMGTTDGIKQVKLSDFVFGIINKKFSPRDLVNYYYDNLNAADTPENLRRQMGHYVEKSLRSKSAQSNVPVRELIGHMKLLEALADPSPLEKWPLLVRLARVIAS